MTATPDLLDDLVEGSTYQLGASPERPDGSGGVRWDLMRFQRPDQEAAALAGRCGPMWCQIASRVTPKPEPVGYRDAALEQLRGYGLDPAATDVVLVLPDRVERLRPEGTGIDA